VARHYRDLAAWQLAMQFEGFLRFSVGDFKRFLDYSLGSLGEAEGRLEDGIQLGYFDRGSCENAFRFAKRCLAATIRLKRSQRDTRSQRA
jgi:hypothetical protein